MTLREISEAREHDWLHEGASFSDQSKGRSIKETPCDYRTAYQRDRDRIIHSKAFRRLKHKTQVFLSPEGDHYRTRLTHALEVAQISRTIARALRLNEDLTEAIALGHDLGHTPFGHCGEAELDLLHEGGFKHREQSLRVVEKLERRKAGTCGLNLTWEVKDGILHHSGPDVPHTLEGQIVRLCDRIAYINHDIDDATRAGVLDINTLPKSFVDHFGTLHSKRIDLMIVDVIETSKDMQYVRMSDAAWVQMQLMRDFMFETVYLNEKAKGEETKARALVRYLYEYFVLNPDRLPQEQYDAYKEEGKEAIKDFIAGMSDRYAVNFFKEITVPRYWQT